MCLLVFTIIIKTTGIYLQQGLLKHQPQLGDLENNNSAKEKLFSCSGYAETRPIASNETEEGKEANRRIDIRFTMTPPQEETAEIVKDIEKQLR